MECFNHANSAAVAVCKSCARAVCRSCAKDMGFAIACSPNCETEARQQHEMSIRAKRIYGIGATKQVFPLAVLTWVLFAALFGGFGIFSTFVLHRAEWFLLIFGAISLLLAIVSYRRSKSLQLNC